MASIDMLPHTIPCIGLSAIEKVMTSAKSKEVSEKIKGITCTMSEN